jgi:hypothetical protein
METYKMKYRRSGSWLWSCMKNLIGHRYDSSTNKMVFYFANGSLREVAEWNNCECFLDTDWVIWTKKQMEKEAGQTIPLTIQDPKMR